LSSITPLRSARNLGDVIDDQLNFTDHIARTAHPADLPCTTLGGSGPPYQSMLNNSLSNDLFYPDCTIEMLSCQVFQLENQTSATNPK